MSKKITDYGPHLRVLLGRLDAAYLRADDDTRPKIDARRAIVRADLHDRSVGLTASLEVTPAVGFLYRYRVLA